MAILQEIGIHYGARAAFAPVHQSDITAVQVGCLPHEREAQAGALPQCLNTTEDVVGRLRR